MIVIKNKGLRRAVSLAVPIMILALALLSALFFDSRRHMIVSLTAAAMTVVLFISGFEKKSTGTRRLVIVSVMTALCFLGRFIPILKPIMALTIITGIYLGGESGFLVGAMTAILTNFYFGQGLDSLSDVRVGNSRLLRRNVFNNVEKEQTSAHHLRSIGRSRLLIYYGHLDSFVVQRQFRVKTLPCGTCHRDTVYDLVCSFERVVSVDLCETVRQ